MAHVEPWSWHGCDEELAAVGAWSCVGHREDAWLVEGDITSALVFEILAPNGLATHTGASWIATLDHEFFDDTMEDDTVVVAVLDVSGEIFASLRCDVFEELEFDVTLCGFEDDVGHGVVSWRLCVVD